MPYIRHIHLIRPLKSNIFISLQAIGGKARCLRGDKAMQDRSLCRQGWPLIQYFIESNITSLSPQNLTISLLYIATSSLSSNDQFVYRVCEGGLEM